MSLRLELQDGPEADAAEPGRIASTLLLGCAGVHSNNAALHHADNWDLSVPRQNASLRDHNDSLQVFDIHKAADYQQSQGHWPGGTAFSEISTTSPLHWCQHH